MVSAPHDALNAENINGILYDAAHFVIIHTQDQELIFPISIIEKIEEQLNPLSIKINSRNRGKIIHRNLLTPPEALVEEPESPPVKKSPILPSSVWKRGDTPPPGACWSNVTECSAPENEEEEIIEITPRRRSTFFHNSFFLQKSAYDRFIVLNSNIGRKVELHFSE